MLQAIPTLTLEQVIKNPPLIWIRSVIYIHHALLTVVMGNPRPTNYLSDSRFQAQEKQVVVKGCYHSATDMILPSEPSTGSRASPRLRARPSTTPGRWSSSPYWLMAGEASLWLSRRRYRFKFLKGDRVRTEGGTPGARAGWN
jgi:hypothetical protein